MFLVKALTGCVQIAADSFVISGLSFVIHVARGNDGAKPPSLITLVTTILLRPLVHLTLCV
jgi:hypothetical protein